MRHREIECNGALDHAVDEGGIKTAIRITHF